MIVEFVLIFSVFLLLISFVVQGGFLFNAWLTATNAAREASRWGAPCLDRSVQACSLQDVYNAAQAALVGVDQTRIRQIEACTTTDSNSNQLVTVQVTYSVPILAPFMDQFFPPGGVAITGSSDMRLENQLNSGSFVPSCYP